MTHKNIAAVFEDNVCFITVHWILTHGRCRWVSEPWSCRTLQMCSNDADPDYLHESARAHTRVHSTRKTLQTV